MKIGLTFNLRPDSDLPYQCGRDENAEFDTLSTIEALESTLNILGHQPFRIGTVREVLENVGLLTSMDLVFNVCEGSSAVSREGQVPAILDALNVPYVFSDPLTMCACLHKMTAKRLLMQEGIPTPDAVLVGHETELKRLRLPSFPLFVKPSHEGTSKGIDGGAVVSGESELARRVKFINESYHQCALVEEFVPGREFTVGIIGTGMSASVIGTAQIHLKNSLGVYGIYEKELCEELVSYEVESAPEAVATTALRAYRTLGCRDAGRVDLMARRNGALTVLEVNPLPGLHPSHSDLPIIAAATGLGYDGLVEGILASALERRDSAIAMSDFHLRTLVTSEKCCTE